MNSFVEFECAGEENISKPRIITIDSIISQLNDRVFIDNGLEGVIEKTKILEEIDSLKSVQSFDIWTQIR